MIEFPSHWSNCQLGERIRFEYGKSPNEVRCSDGKYPVYGSSGKTALAINYTTESPAIIVGRKGTIDKPIFLQERCWAIDTTFFADKFPSDDPKYLFFLLDSINLRSLNESTGVPSLSRDALHSIPVSLPPLPEQKKIAEILSGIDNLIKMIDIKILKLKIAIAEVFRDVFSDFSPTEEEAVFPQDISKSIKTLPLESVCEAVVDCKNRTPPYVDQGYPVIRTPNVRNGRLVIADLRYTDEESYQIWTARSVPRPMDILFTREAPLGEACLIPNGFRCCLGQRMMLFRANKSLLDPQYLLYAMMSTFVQEQLGKSKGGTTVGHARVADIRKIKIPILPMEKQLQIAFLLASINSCLQQTIEKKKKMQVKKNALASDLLSGRKRVST